MSSDDIPVDFERLGVKEGGKYECPICHEYEADSIRSVQGHISGTRDDLHGDLGWNFEDEIKKTYSPEDTQRNR